MNRTLLLIPLRNLAAHKTATLIVGSIIFFGTFLVVLGTALIDSIDDSMSKSITSSITGHLQVYSDQTEDKLTLFGGSFMGGDDLGELRDFQTLKTELENLEEIKAVVPMGFVTGTISGGGNRIDQSINQMRDAIESGSLTELGGIKGRLQAIATDLVEARKKLLAIAEDQASLQNSLNDLNIILNEEFWAPIKSDPRPILEFLENNIAKLGETGRTHYFRNLGTDLSRFPKYFDRFEIAKGEMVPPGKRGYIVSTRMYETRLKNQIARQFDKIHKEKYDFGKSIADDPDLKNRAERLPRQYRRITYELTPKNTDHLSQEIEKLIPEAKGDLTAKLEAFLTIDDENFKSRYDFFYEVVAPMIKLYWFDVGDTVTIRSVTKSGYYKSLNIKFYGTYRFKGLEESSMAGAFNLMDMLSFRELYGVMTEEMKNELATIRNEVEFKDVERENVEDALFGADDSVTTENVDSMAFESEVSRAEVSERIQESFSESEINEGLSLTGAVILHNKDDLDNALESIATLNQSKQLGVQTITWQGASGIVGQLIYVIRGVLYFAIAIIFLVAFVIINNSMVMATTERTPEIGTMRAIGAQRQFVMRIFIFETLILGISAGILGSLAAAALLTHWGNVGIPAPADFFIFLFSGKHLYPTFEINHLLFGIAVVILISVASTFYPAKIATKVEPVVAMRGRY